MKLNDLHQNTSADVDLQHLWMPFTNNRQYKGTPRLLKSAKGMYFTTSDDRQVLDSSAGLWCVNAGHCRDEIVQAVQQGVANLDFAPPFQMGHVPEFQAATALAEITPAGMDRIFYTNSGSEGVDTALKMALAFHRANGQGQRTRFIGRERAYHGVGFGGISVGGMVANRKAFSGQMLPSVDHMPATYSLKDMAYSKGQPTWGAHLADELERIAALHDPSTIAAVIVEPMSGSAGALIPPVGYLQRLREICDKHGFILIFDEVITGFGRLGAPFASQALGVTPDLIVCAKGITNGTIPMGAVIAKRHVYDTITNAGAAGSIDFFHGYTYSGHPVASVASIATLALYKREGLFERAAQLAPYFEQAIHSLKGEEKIIDIRNLGLVGAVEMASRPGAPGARGFEVHLECYKRGLLVRVTGDIIVFSPPLIVEKAQIDQIFSTIADVIKTIA
jgi:beta-alanine--pyruvate transaminase